MADETGGTGATPPANDPAAGATPSGQQTGSGATPEAGSTEGATPDPQQGDSGRQAALDRERDLRREAERQAREYRRRVNELEDAGKSETDRLAAQAKRSAEEAEQHARRVAELEGEIARRDLDQLKRDIAAESGLPPSAAHRLQGTDRRSLRADAEALAKELQTGTPVGSAGIGRGNAATGQRQTVDGNAGMNQLIREAAGRG